MDAAKRIAALVLFTCISIAARGQCVSALQPVAQIGSFPNRPAAHLAWNGSVYGVSKVEPQSASHPIYFAVYDASLHAVTTDRQVVASSNGGPLALLWDGSAFGLFYESDNQLRMQRLDTQGNKVGAAVMVGNQSVWQGQEYAITFNPVNRFYQIVHIVPQGLGKGFFLRSVKSDGTIVREDIVLNTSVIVTMPRIAVLADGTTGIAFQLRNDPFTANVEYYDTVYSKDLVHGNLSLLATAGDRLLLASNETSFLAVLTVAVAGGLPEIHAIPIDAASHTGEEVKLIAAREKDIAPISLLWNPSLREWGLVYVDAPNGLFTFPTDTRLRRFTESYDTVADVEFSPDLRRTYLDARYPVIFDGNAYVGALERFVTNVDGSEAYVARHCPFFVGLAAEPAFALVNTNVTLRALPSGGTSPIAYQWDFGDLVVDYKGSAVMAHKYTKPGTYTVTVQATDAQNVVSVATFHVRVVSLKPRAARH